MTRSLTAGAALGALATLVSLAAAPAAQATAPADVQRTLEAAARRADPGFAGFSAQRGQRFFTARHANDWSCATCHGSDPLAAGRHTRTGRTIAPLAPAGSSERFTDMAKVDKWFKRNCNDVLSRECTAQEKGDVLAFLVSLGR